MRIDVATHWELKRLAASLGTSVGDTVALAVRRLRQDRIGADLRYDLSAEEVDWIDADIANGLKRTSAAQCQHVRAVAPSRMEETRGNVGAAALVQVREVLGLILDIPG